MRGGFTVRHNGQESRALSSHKVNVPWTNRNLTVKWESFQDKLQPGQPEKWKATISGPDAKKAVAEMAAVLYDESLDQFKAHQWQQAFGVFRQDNNSLNQHQTSAKPAAPTGPMESPGLQKHLHELPTIPRRNYR